MDINEIRRLNLITLMDREYGAGQRGAKAKLARRLGKQADYISRCLYPKGKEGRKNIGEDFAREIEQTFHLARYAFDAPLDRQSTQSPEFPSPAPRTEEKSLQPCLNATSFTTLKNADFDNALKALRIFQASWKRLSEGQKDEAVHLLLGEGKNQRAIMDLFFQINDAAKVGALTAEEVAAIGTLVRSKRNKKAHGHHSDS